MSRLDFSKLIKTIESHSSEEKIDSKYLNSPLFKDLELSDEEFSKYGSLIKQIIDDEELCAKSATCPFESKTHIRLIRDEHRKIVPITVPCEKALRDKSSSAFIRNYLIKNFSDDLLSIRLSKKYFSNSMDKSASDIINRYISFAKSNDKAMTGFYLYGDYGIGKTYSTIAFTNELARKGQTIAFVFVPDIVYKLKQGFSQESSHNNTIVENMKNADVLILDDIGAEEASVWFYNEYLLVVLNHRMQRNMTTFFISNLSLNDLQRKMLQKKNDPNNVARLLERIKALTKNTELKMVGKNLRY